MHFFSGRSGGRGGFALKEEFVLQFMQISRFQFICDSLGCSDPDLCEETACDESLFFAPPNRKLTALKVSFTASFINLRDFTCDQI
jgi:hypothetical protein